LVASACARGVAWRRYVRAAVVSAESHACTGRRIVALTPAPAVAERPYEEMSRRPRTLSGSFSSQRRRLGADTAYTASLCGLSKPSWSLSRFRQLPFQASPCPSRRLVASACARASLAGVLPARPSFGGVRLTRSAASCLHGPLFGGVTSVQVRAWRRHARSGRRIVALTPTPAVAERPYEAVSRGLRTLLGLFSSPGRRLGTDSPLRPACVDSRNSHRPVVSWISAPGVAVHEPSLRSVNVRTSRRSVASMCARVVVRRRYACVGRCSAASHPCEPSPNGVNVCVGRCSRRHIRASRRLAASMCAWVVVRGVTSVRAVA
jgi:hypothetical protein